MQHTVEFTNAYGADITATIETTYDKLEGNYTANGLQHSLGYSKSAYSRQAAINELLQSNGARLRSIQTEGEDNTRLIDAELSLSQCHEDMLRLQAEVQNYKALAENTAKLLDEEQQHHNRTIRDAEPARQLEQRLIDALRPAIAAEIAAQLNNREPAEIDYSELADALDYSQLEIDHSQLEIDYSELADALDVEDQVYDAVRSQMDGLQLRNVNITLEM